MSTTNGKICYVELPAIDVARSAAFYATAFGWKMRRRGDGQTAFDDSTGAVSGAFVLDRAAAGPPPDCWSISWWIARRTRWNWCWPMAVWYFLALPPTPFEPPCLHLPGRLGHWWVKMACYF